MVELVFEITLFPFIMVPTGLVGGIFLCNRMGLSPLNQVQVSPPPLPPLQPFRKQLYYSSKQTHGTEKQDEDDIPIVIQGIDPVSYYAVWHVIS